MAYQLEISFNLKKRANLTETKNLIINKANKFESNRYYENFEMACVNRTMKRNHYVLTFFFETSQELVAKFIKFIKSEKNIYIESIYDDNNHELLYASSKYLNMMEKECVKAYLNNKKKGIFKEKYSIIINQINNKRTT
tara:strand:- start:206 stop:622 length:417 start_codon:yes stop_codon:yes gene_type:complete